MHVRSPKHTQSKFEKNSITKIRKFFFTAKCHRTFFTKDCIYDLEFDHKRLSNIPCIVLAIQSSTCVLMKGYIL